MSENKVKAYDESYMDELEITTADDLYKNENEGFVLISYCSKNKKTVFRDVVIPMQKNTDCEYMRIKHLTTKTMNGLIRCRKIWQRARLY